LPDRDASTPIDFHAINDLTLLKVLSTFRGMTAKHNDHLKINLSR